MNTPKTRKYRIKRTFFITRMIFVPQKKIFLFWIDLPEGWQTSIEDALDCIRDDIERNSKAKYIYPSEEDIKDRSTDESH